VASALTGLMTLAMPVHLFAHMRGVYRTSVFGALIRMALLSVMTIIVLSLGVTLLVLVGLSGLPIGGGA
jgi:hypothetical protein